MAVPRFNLIVLRVADLEQATCFYELLDFQFVKHAHGAGPQHYSAEANGVVFELYSATTDQPVSTSARIGFAVDQVNEIAARLAEFPGAKLIAPPRDSEWGRRAVVADPDGHRVELTAGR
jgi:predicted enzyme related to lactoylglutathione lyase